MGEFKHIICPKCNERLQKDSNMLKCKNGHSYDIASQGYVNLLPPHKSGEIPGDSKEMINARRNFLSKGYYLPLADRLCKIIKELHPDIIADIGCGEGYYTSKIRSATDSYTIGIDISKFALSAASKTDRQTDYCAASLHALPIADNSANVLLCCFCAYDENEFARVLKNGGKFILVTPGKRHLFGLKSVLYDEPYENAEQTPELNGFALENTQSIKYNINIADSDDIWNLFSMTPYFWTTKKSGAEKLKELTQLSTEVEFNIQTYTRL